MKEFTLKKGQQYKAFTVSSPNTVYNDLCGYSLRYLKTLWWGERNKWKSGLSGEEKIDSWIRISVLTTILIERNCWDNEKKQPVEEDWKTYTPGTPSWKEYWKNNPENQYAMIEHMKERQ